MTTVVHVAVAVIVQQHQVLIALRKPDQHQGDLWEFPGGKVEANETVFDALTREIEEEVNLRIVSANPLTQVSHDYGDKSVLLDVWTVNAFEGTPVGREGQTVKWCDIAILDQHAFPAANKPILNAIEQNIK